MSLSLRQPGLGELSEEWKAFEKQVPIPSLIGDPKELRAAANLNPLPAIPPGLLVKDEIVPGFKGHQNTVRIYSPIKLSKLEAIVLYIHGGGWTLGDLNSEDAVCRTICIENQVIVISIDYRKAPENPFPTGLEDAWAAVLWTFENIASLGGSPDNVVIAGLSAGANFAAVLAQRATRTREVSFTGQILRFPIVVHPEAQPPGLDFSSYEENADSPFLSTHATKVCLSYYKPTKDDLRMSPLLADDIADLPRTFIQIAGADPLRDDGFAYAEKLHEAGVPVRTRVYAGMPHAFSLFPLNASRSSDQDLVRGIKWLIGDE